jgi:hypothetical protein
MNVAFSACDSPRVPAIQSDEYHATKTGPELMRAPASPPGGSRLQSPAKA